MRYLSPFEYVEKEILCSCLAQPKIDPGYVLEAMLAQSRSDGLMKDDPCSSCAKDSGNFKASRTLEDWRNKMC